jgi:hypothetical protein
MWIFIAAQATATAGADGRARPAPTPPVPAGAPPASIPAARPAPAVTSPAATTRSTRAANERRARRFFQDGMRLFEHGNKGEALNQALINFQFAQELAPRPENLAMMAHCEYHLGLFKEARAHYEQYLEHESSGPLAETARQRIEAMNRRKASLVINSIPEGVEVTLERLDSPDGSGNGEDTTRITTGQAPGEFRVPAGRWRVTAAMPKYVSKTVEVALEGVESKPLYFTLERRMARLEIRTDPPNATLYVRGNRARNPYIQDVEPGTYEVYAEATNYESRTETYFVVPGENRKIPFNLNYVQRSGRAELIGFWTAAGAVAGGAGVGAWLSRADRTDTTLESVGASATVVVGAALVGGVAGALTSTAFVPGYLRDNLALFRIGAAWIGAVEGAALGVTLRHSTAAAWVGGAAGLGLGAVGGRFLDRNAPNYGRGAVIQSAAAIGALAGALAVPAFDLKKRHSAAVILAGLNLGLGAGLGLAYLPDQGTYGPTWRRVMLIDLATAAGGIGGALIKIVGQCLQTKGGSKPCAFETGNGQPTAQFALVGAGLGLAAGWLLTRQYDTGNLLPSERAPLALLPLPTVLPVPAPDGRLRALPALAARGTF